MNVILPLPLIVEEVKPKYPRYEPSHHVFGTPFATEKTENATVTVPDEGSQTTVTLTECTTLMKTSVTHSPFGLATSVEKSCLMCCDLYWEMSVLFRHLMI